jgi:IS4 transposase
MINLLNDLQYTKEHSRYHNPGAKKKDFNRAKSENLGISGLGDILVTFSWKKRNRKYDKRLLKVLLCSNPHMSTEEILELYALRWQIEIFFRELKSDLGLSGFSGRSFKAFERHVDLIWR